jgi:hypothetical protein
MSDDGEKAAPAPPGREPGSGLTPRFSNWVHVNVNGDITRIVFGNLVDGPPEFHTSMAVQTETAVRFAKLLLQLAEANKERSRKIQEAWATIKKPSANE